MMIDEKILVERLEEQRGHICHYMPCNGCKYIGDCNDRDHAEDVALDKAIEIVNQLAEESKDDFCEWKFEETTGIVWHCDEKCTTYNLSYAQNLKIILSDFECKCPHCGKKIKVYEPEEE